MHNELLQATLQCTIPITNEVPALRNVCAVLSSRPKKHASVVETAPLIVALLMDKPRTARELSVDGEIDISTVKRWLVAFEAAGVLVREPHPTRHTTNRHGSVQLWRMHQARAVS